ncbi:hypothetical protein VTN77DRAFT_8655 [Rasamsonia byssochlamydoides]|uniref:uncharacterized protein n=1 Tax=Rasamsonia byssochlamydoides TaxID=89139 RepID=UPI003743AE50
MKDFFLICGLLASTVYGHMQMSNPYPIRSPLNPNGGDNKDYSYTSPLSPSGSDYPCKGYANDPFVSVATYTAGQSYDLELAGSATHGGGSCQISLSYDKGKSFTVIESIEGGCPLAKNYTFTIPSDAPTGEALLAWTWFNKIGNREMYMNCAQVTINGGSSKRGHPRDFYGGLVRRGVAFSNRPPIFLANINAEGQCTTIANEEVRFPLPGPDVVGSVSSAGYTCKGSAPFLGTNSSSSTPSSSSTAPSSSSAGPSPASPSSSAAMSSASLSNGTASSTPAAVPSSSATASPKIVGSGPCTDGQITCSADGNSFAMCDHGSLINMGSVAAGTVCKNGAIQMTGR